MNVLNYLQIKLNQLSTAYIPPPKIKSSRPRKILLVHAHPCSGSSFSSAIANAVQKSAVQSGHAVQRIDLNDSYRAVMTSEERISYFKHQEQDIQPPATPPVSSDIQQHLRALQWCDTLIFVYPTWWMNTPALLKGFFDRTLLPGETWTFPSATAGKSTETGLVPLLTNVKTMVGISTYGASKTIVRLSGDNGRRMISNAIRPIMHRDCTLLWLGLYDMDFTDQKGRQRFLEEVEERVTEL